MMPAQVQTPPAKPTLRYSHLAMGLFCGEKYRRRVIEHETQRDTLWWIRGKGVHKAREVDMVQKIDSHEDLPLAELQDVARDEVNAGFAGEVTLDPEEAGSLKDIRGETVDVAVALTGHDYQEHLQQLQPAWVERHLMADVQALPYILTGRPDLYTVEQRIHDAKTGKAAPPGNAAERSEQLTMYAFLAQANKIPVADLSLDFLWRTPARKECKARRLSTTRGVADYQVMLNRVWAFIKSLEAGVFLPAPDGHFLCSIKFCEFYVDCPYARAAT